MRSSGCQTTSRRRWRLRYWAMQRCRDSRPTCHRLQARADLLYWARLRCRLRRSAENSGYASKVRLDKRPLTVYNFESGKPGPRMDSPCAIHICLWGHSNRLRIPSHVTWRREKGGPNRPARSRLLRGWRATVMANIVVVGAQWGDEAKGKVVDYLAREAEMVVRYGGGNNAGHSVIVGDTEYKFHLIPAGIVNGNTACVD